MKLKRKVTDWLEHRTGIESAVRTRRDGRGCLDIPGTPMRCLSFCQWYRWTATKRVVATSSPALGGSADPKTEQA